MPDLLPWATFLLLGGGILWVARRYHVPFEPNLRRVRRRGDVVSVQVTITNASKFHMSAFKPAATLWLDPGGGRDVVVRRTERATLEPGSEMLIAFSVKPKFLGEPLQIEITYRTLLRRLLPGKPQQALLVVDLPETAID